MEKRNCVQALDKKNKTVIVIIVLFMEVAPSPLRANLRLMTMKEYLGDERKKMNEKKLKNLLIGFLNLKKPLLEILPGGLSEIKDMETLIFCSREVCSGSESEFLIEKRMVEVLPEKLPEIDDMEILILYWENISSESEAQLLVETRIKERLSEIKDIKTLINHRKKACAYKLWSLIDARIKERLSDIEDMKTLMYYRHYWENTISWWLGAWLFDARMAEILPKILPKINDMETLIRYRENSSSGTTSEAQSLIEAKMAEILPKKLPEINDVETLIRYRENASSGSKAQSLIDARIKERLSDIEDMETLVKHWKKARLGTRAHSLIGTRMAEVFKNFTISAEPKEWFVEMISEMVENRSVPKDLDGCFEKNVQDFLIKL